MDMEALKLKMDTIGNDILRYKPVKAVPCDKFVIGMVNNYMDDYMVPVHAMRSILYGNEEADRLQRADVLRTPLEKQQQGLWITNSISLIIRKSSRPDTVSAETSEAEGMEGATCIQDLAGKVGCMVKIVDMVDIENCVEESKKIKEITGRFPVCAILYSERSVDQAKGIYMYALKGSGMTDHYEVPWPCNIRTDMDKFEWLSLLHKCLPEADRMLAAQPRLESESRAAEQKQNAQLQRESEIRAAEQKQKAGPPQQM